VYNDLQNWADRSLTERVAAPMAAFKNEFSWSKTRDETFTPCPRQYWFAYYGFWNGWLKDPPERTRQIYVLKNYKDRQTWAKPLTNHV
jgi:hypothetical protein